MHSDSPTARRSHAALAVKILLALLVLGLVVLLPRWVPVEALLAWVTQQVHDLGVWGPLTFGAVYVVLTVLLLPSTPVVLAAGALFGPALATLIISLASTVSAALSFLFSRYVAYHRVARHVPRYPRLAVLWQALGARDGWKIVVAIRLAHLGPFGAQSLLFGLSPVRFWPFVFATWISMLPGTFLYAYLGFVGAAALSGDEARPVDWAIRLGIPVVVAVALVFIVLYARRVLRETTETKAAGPD